jgi:hypothetical protein
VNKKEPKKLNEKECEVVKDINVKYYGVIVAPTELVEALFNASATSNAEKYQSLLHACLWRCAGVKTTGSSSFFNWLKGVGIEDSDGVVRNHTNILFNTLAGNISEKLKTFSAGEKEKIMTDNKAVISMFVDSYGWPIKDKPTNHFFSGVNLFNTDKVATNFPNKNTYIKAARCVEACLDSLVLGVGDAPIYVPSITDGVVKTITLIALFKDHPLYDVFKKRVLKITNTEMKKKGDKKSIEEITVKVEKLTKELFDKLKKG